LGNTRVVLNDDGTVKEYYDYYPFGKIQRSSITDEAVTTFKFTGKELDDENDLNWYNFGARPYDHIIGRFICPDPHAQNYPNLSPYCYVGNNPLRFIDPHGYDLADVHKIVSAIHTTLNEAWKNSFNKNGIVAEVSGAIISTDNSIYAKNIKKGTTVVYIILKRDHISLEKYTTFYKFL
jgi:RHS repeat-associated protein